MSDDGRLRITGPTPLPATVRAATARQVVSHRSADFAELFRGVVDRLRPVFGADADTTILPLTTSGTGAMEAVVQNLVRPGARVLSVQTGYFGQRFADVAATYGAVVSTCVASPGEAPGDEDLRTALAEGPDLVLLTHNETSLGVCLDLARVMRVVREEAGPLVVLDAVSSAAAVAIDMAVHGVDAVITASQKALMSPPGLAFVALNERALAAASSNARPRYYFDFGRAVEEARRGSTPFTPAVNAMFGVDAALRLLQDEGLSRVFERHRGVAARCRGRLADAGLSVVARRDVASATVTAVRLPAGQSADDVRARLEARYGVRVSGGRGELKHSVLRFGHMGNVTAGDVDVAVTALLDVLEAPG